jgi:hypothetical protein
MVGLLVMEGGVVMETRSIAEMLIVPLSRSKHRLGFLTTKLRVLRDVPTLWGHKESSPSDLNESDIRNNYFTAPVLPKNKSGGRFAMIPGSCGGEYILVEKPDEFPIFIAGQQT